MMLLQRNVFVYKYILLFSSLRLFLFTMSTMDAFYARLEEVGELVQEAVDAYRKEADENFAKLVIAEKRITELEEELARVTG